MPNELVPDFQVFTSPMVLLKKGLALHHPFKNLPEDHPRPMLWMTGSSTEQDLQKDTMMLTALQDMCTAHPGMSTWLNHLYSVPRTFLGQLVVSPLIIQQDGFADLHIITDVFTDVEDSAKTLSLVEQGARFGCSGGFMILEWSFDGDPDEYWDCSILIHRVQPLEWSVCGIPANQRSWVEGAIKGMFERYVTEDNGEQARLLAPAVKGLYSRDFKDILQTVKSVGLRKELESAPMRPTSGQSIRWNPNDKKYFLLERGRQKHLDVAQASLLIKEANNTYTEKAMTIKAEETPEVAETQEPVIASPVATEETPVTHDAPESVTETQEPVVTQEETETPIATEEPPVEAPVNTESTPEVMEPLEIVIDLDPVKQYQLTQFNALGLLLFGEQWKSASASHFRIETKEGRAISTANMKSLKIAHDALAAVGGTDVCSNAPANDGNDNEDDGVDSGDGSTKAYQKAYADALGTLEPVLKSITDLTIALKSAKSVEDLTERTEVLHKELAALDIKHRKAITDVNALADTVAVLKDMPVGDPRSVKRSLNLEGEAVANIKDLLPINQEHWTLESAVAKTSKTVKTLHDGSTLTVRVWPEGVGKGIASEVEGGVRPELSRKQVLLMSPMMRIAYESGQYSEVALTPGDDPEEMLARQAALAH